MAAVPEEEEEENIEDYGAAGCLAWSQFGEWKKGGIPAIIRHFHGVCQSNGFVGHCAALGFANPSFHPNHSTYLSAGHAGYDKFAACLSSESHQRELQAANACLGVVFHGTATANIDSILQNGLDKNRRSGQSYGPGEYFSMEPTLSVSYCKGGLEMLVFVVVLPPTLPKKEAGKVRTKCPPDYVVVENNQHHLALGVLKFHSVNHSVMALSQSRRQSFRALSQEVFVKGRIKQEAETKAKIIQHLIAAKVDVAAELYQKKASSLCHLSKREISWYVHQKLDDDVHSWYFPELPPPMKWDEMVSAKVQNLDDAAKEEREAKKQLEDARMTIVGDGGGVVASRPASAAPVFGMPALPAAAPVFGMPALPAAAPVFGIPAPSAAAANPAIADPAPMAVATAVASGPTRLDLLRQKRGALSGVSTSTQNSGSDPSTLILKHLIANRVDMASELYSRKQQSIDLNAKKEIFNFANRCMDDPSLLSALFPGLPQACASTPNARS